MVRTIMQDLWLQKHRYINDMQLLIIYVWSWQRPKEVALKSLLEMESYKHFHITGMQHTHTHKF